MDTDEYLAKCLVYIDLNMVRAGIVKHPSLYRTSGYHELQHPPERYSIIDWVQLLDLFGFYEKSSFQKTHLQWVEAELEKIQSVRNPLWSESIAVGTEGFIETIRKELPGKTQGRELVYDEEMTSLREPTASYNALFSPEKRALRS